MFFIMYISALVMLHIYTFTFDHRLEKFARQV